MAFVPPKYGDLGKSVKDMLTDDFKYKNKVVVKRKTKCGLKIDTTATATGKGIDGSVKTVYKNSDLGEIEVVGATNDSWTGKWKLAKIADGVKATIKAACGGKDADRSGSVVVDYSQESFAVTVDATTQQNGDVNSGKVKVGAVMGLDGVSLGCVMKSKVDNKFNFSSPDFNMAFQIDEDDFSFGLATETLEDKTTGLRAKLHQTVNSKLSRALEFSSPENTLTVAFKNQLDDATSLKVSVTTAGCIQTALAHTLADPRAQLKLATQFSTTNGMQVKAEKFGLGITVGDF